MAASPSPHWSGSAGAIYPVFRRLEERGWIDTRVAKRGRRAGKECRVSRAGRAALRRWLGPPVPDWVAELSIDPLRVRMRFLGALPPSMRARFLDEARDALRDSLATIDADCARLAALDDPFPHAMARGAWHVTRARLEWLDEVAAALD
jgi:DNA-binding PadR family transcriptional regulator